MIRRLPCSIRLSLFDPLGHRMYRRIFFSTMASTFGDWVTNIAILIVLGYRWHSGPDALAAYAIGLALPYVIAAPLAGLIVDRVAPRTAMVSCDLARSLVVLALIAARNVPQLIALVVVRGLFSAVFNPAAQTVVKKTVPSDTLLAANSLIALATQLTKVAGPAIGAAIITAAGPTVVFCIDAASFVTSALLLLGLNALSVDIQPREISSQARVPASNRFVSKFKASLAEIREGGECVVRSRALLIAIGGQGLVVFLLLLFDTLSPLALHALGLPATAFGLSIACVGIGGAVGSALVGQFGSRFQPFKMMGSGIALAGGSVAFVGIAIRMHLGLPDFAWLIVLLGMGLATAAVIVPYPFILQVSAPEAALGRVMAIALAVPLAAQMIGPIIGASLAVRFGIAIVVLVSGSGLLLVGCGVTILGPDLSRHSDNIETVVTRAEDRRRTAEMSPDGDVSAAEQGDM